MGCQHQNECSVYQRHLEDAKILRDDRTQEVSREMCCSDDPADYKHCLVWQEYQKIDKTPALNYQI